MASSKKKGPVEKIALQCTECKRKNYSAQSASARTIQPKRTAAILQTSLSL